MNDRGFQVSLGSFRNNTFDRYNRLKRGVAIKLFSAVIRSSPVDTGRFRANWRCSVASPNLATDENASDKSGGKAIAAMQAVVLPSKAEDELWLSNSLPYAIALEYGYSKQAPAGVVRLNVKRFDDLLSKQLRQS